MKKIYTHLLFVTVVLSTTVSCKKLLKEEPRSFIVDEQFYKTPQDAEYAVNAAYFFFNGYSNSSPGNTGTGQTTYQSMLNVGMDLASDDLYPGPGATNPDVRSLAVHNHSSANRTFYENWQQHYAGVRKANVVLQKVPAIDFGTANDKKKRILAEAKFIRAWIYFNLVRLWGDVPLVLDVKENVTDATEFYVAGTPSSQIYDQIQKDLIEAAADLPITYPTTELGRATKGAANALLVKVYLTRASFPLKQSEYYQKAVDQALTVVSAGITPGLTPAGTVTVPGASGPYGYNLRADYSHVFLPAFKNNEEHIFSGQRTGSLSQGNNDFARTLPRGLVPGINGLYADQLNFYTKGDDKQFNLYKLYQQKDKRRKASFATRFRGNTTATANTWYSSPLANPAYPGDSIPYINKLYDPSSLAVPNNSAANTTLYRYSELLLNLAEAENEVNGPSALAYAAYNKVRERAGLDLFNVGDLDQNAFRDSVYLDRRLEIVFEYQRWFDLIRQRDENNQPSFVRNLKEAGKVNARDVGRLFPIPQIELDNNRLLKQNPGWE